jgi:hypothetical protein
MNDELLEYPAGWIMFTPLNIGPSTEWNKPCKQPGFNYVELYENFDGSD